MITATTRPSSGANFTLTPSAPPPEPLRLSLRRGVDTRGAPARVPWLLIGGLGRGSVAGSPQGTLALQERGQLSGRLSRSFRSALGSDGEDDDPSPPGRRRSSPGHVAEVGSAWAALNAAEEEEECAEQVLCVGLHAVVKPLTRPFTRENRRIRLSPGLSRAPRGTEKKKKKKAEDENRRPVNASSMRRFATEEFGSPGIVSRATWACPCQPLGRVLFVLGGVRRGSGGGPEGVRRRAYANRVSC
eukprot:1193265-Prorocentrum_minimum.AAC.1